MTDTFSIVSRRLEIRDLSVLQYANGFKLWHAKCGEATLADLMAPGYFDQAKGMLAPGDMILCSYTTGGTQLYVMRAGDDGVRVTGMTTP
jgi:hypothetical protein